MNLASNVGASLLAVCLLLVSAPALAQDDPVTTPPPPVTTMAPPVITTAPAAPASTGVADAKSPSWSIALERVGGIGYAKATDESGDNSVSVTALGIGGVTPNPFAIPRVGVDYITESGVTVGGAAGFSRISASAASKNDSQDVGSVILYTFTPRVGYRIPLSEHVDLTPRAGLTLAGASLSPAEGNSSASIFAVAIGADAPFAFRLTNSFNLLAGVGLDYTVSATATAKTESTTVVSGPGGSTTTKDTDEAEAKGSLFSLQGWIGLGGYL